MKCLAGVSIACAGRCRANDALADLRAQIRAFFGPAAAGCATVVEAELTRDGRFAV